MLKNEGFLFWGRCPPESADLVKKDLVFRQGLFGLLRNHYDTTYILSVDAKGGLIALYQIRICKARKVEPPKGCERKALAKGCSREKQAARADTLRSAFFRPWSARQRKNCCARYTAAPKPDAALGLPQRTFFA